VQESNVSVKNTLKGKILKTKMQRKNPQKLIRIKLKTPTVSSELMANSSAKLNC